MSQFRKMLLDANVRAAEGYEIVTLVALGTTSFGAVYRYNGPPKDIGFTEPKAEFFG